jgi:hypothetical protein
MTAPLTASGSGSVGLLLGAGAGETVNTAGTQAFLDKNVGTGNKVVRASGVTIKDSGNADVTGNYAVTYLDNLTSTISPAALTVTAQQVSRTYDGTTTASGSGSVGLLLGAGAGETVNTAGTQAFLDKNVGTGNKVVRASGVTIKDSGNADVTGNYAVTYLDNLTSTISPAALTVTAQQVSRTYDGSTTASGSGSVGLLLGAGAGETVNTAGTQAFLDKNVGTGNKVVRASGVTIKDSGNADVTGNYAVTYLDNLTSTISPAALTVTAQSVSRTYDGTTTASGSGSVGLLLGAGAGETVNTAGTQAFLDKNVGTGNKVVRASGVTIKDSGNADVTGNYNISYVDNTASTINQRPSSTWVGNVNGGFWSNAANWDALPDGNNVAAVTIGSGSANVVFDLAGTTNLQSINSAGGLTLAGGNLVIGNNLTTAQYGQTSGNLSGAGSLNVTSSFSQSGGTNINLGGPVTINQASGNLNVGSITASGIKLTASVGSIGQTAELKTTGLLETNSRNGTVLNEPTNAVAAFKAASTVTGNVELTTVSTLNVQGVTTANGDIKIVDTGGMRTTGLVKANNGSASLTANSPLKSARTASKPLATSPWWPPI